MELTQNKMKMKTTISTIVLGAMFCTGMLSGCSKEQQTETPEPQNQMAQVTFTSQLTSEVQSKAEVSTTPLATGTKMLIAVYRKKGNNDYLTDTKPANMYKAPEFFSVTGAGGVTPDDGSNFSMFKDTYTFVAFSKNSSNTEGMTWEVDGGGARAVILNLASNVDYIGTTVKDQVVSSSIELPLSFKRLCSKVVLDVTKDDATISSMTVTGIKTSAVETGTMGIENGGETRGNLSWMSKYQMPTTVAFDMTKVSDNSYSYIHIPAQVSSSYPLKMEITATVQPVGVTGMGVEKKYTLTVESLTFDKGKIYQYTANISASGISFTGIPQVNEWPANSEEVTLDPSEE